MTGETIKIDTPPAALDGAQAGSRGNIDPMMERSIIEPETTFLTAVESGSGEIVSRCHQCRKCTNGCPVAFAMDFPPDRLLHAIILGLCAEVLRSKTIWICAACQTCTTRCPNDIDLAHLMDTLRQMSRAGNYPPGEEKVVRFHEAFLRSVERHGRAFELGLVGHYKLSARDLMGDARLGWEMFKKGKFPLWPAEVHDKEAIRKFFRKARKV